ncbi:MAG: GHMP family kinase ATP-binding protein, partial [Octadecabacter sp.]
MTVIDGRGLPERAHAKINLTLHVIGQRPDGYHILDSVVAFANIGDAVYVHTKAKKMAIDITGPFADGLSGGEDNLVMRAARALSSGKKAKITLEKNLPVASGIGGGSADAAATLRLLSRR